MYIVLITQFKFSTSKQHCMGFANNMAPGVSEGILLAEHEKTENFPSH